MRGEFNMKVVGVLSDTHADRVDGDLKDLFIKGAFKDLNTFIHAGDYTSVHVVNFLEKFIFYGVQGNMDDYSIREKLPLKRIIEIEGAKIGITHGWGAPFGLDKKVYDFFADPTLDCIVFGHSHNPTSHLIGKTLMFNPGSFKHSLVSPRRTVGKLIIDNGKIRGEIIKI